MKKIYTTPQVPAVNSLKNSCSPYRLPFIKTISLVSIAAFLSSASPVFACDKWGNVAQYFGGGANILKSIAPTYMINGRVYRDVGSAFAGVDSTLASWGNIFVFFKKDIDKKLDKISSDMIVKQDDTGLITIGRQVSGAKVSIANVNGATRILSGVGAGSIAATSTDAVNGSQIYSMSNEIASYFGGKAGYKDGKWTAPTFTVKVFDEDGNGSEQNYHNVADAFTGVSGSLTSLDKKIENIATNVTANSLVKQDDTGLVTIGGQVSGAKVSIANVNGATRILSGVASGSIAATSTDAVNGSQIYSMSNEIASYFGGKAGYKDGKWTAPTFTVKVFDEDGNGSEQNYHNVADAFTGVSSSFTSLDKKIENIATNVTANSLVKQDTAGLITIGGQVSGERVSIANVHNAERILSGVASGSITAISTDAVNGSQLHAISNEIASYFSDGAGYDEEGKWISPTFTLKVFDKAGNGTEHDYQNVADAFTGVSSSFTNLNEKIEKVTGDSFIKQNSVGLITIGGSKNGNRIDIANSANAPRILSGVKGGAFTKTSTEAVNGSQLYSMAQAFASYFGGGAGYDEKGKWSGPTFTVKAFDKDGNETEHSYTSVADAFAGVNSAFSTLNEQIIDIRDGALIAVPSSRHGESEIVTHSFPFMRSMFMRIAPMSNGEPDPEALHYNLDSPFKKVSFAGNIGNRLLVGVAAGEVSSDSAQAINGSQLYAVNTEIAKYFGGTTKYEDNAWVAPTFKVFGFNKDGAVDDNIIRNDVATAFDAVSNGMKLINDRLTAVEKKETSDGGQSWIADEKAREFENKVNTIDQQVKDLKTATDEAIIYEKNPEGTGRGNAIKLVGGDATKGVTIENVAGGQLAEGSSNAATVGQVWDVDQKATKAEDATKELKQQTTTLEQGASQLKQDVKNLKAVTDIAVAYDTDDNGQKINSIKLVGGNESDPVLIDNVAEGKIEKGSKQAVTGGQLHDYTEDQMKVVLSDAKQYTDSQAAILVNKGVTEAKSYTDKKFEALSYDIKNVRKEARQAAAIGLAVSNLRYFDDPGSLSVSFGGGLWRGQSAIAFGAGYTSEDGKIRSNLSATSAGGQWGVGGGITLKLK